MTLLYDKKLGGIMFDTKLAIAVFDAGPEPDLTVEELTGTNCQGLSDNFYSEIITISFLVTVLTVAVIAFAFSLFWGFVIGAFVFMSGLLFATEMYESSAECKISKANKRKIVSLRQQLRTTRFKPIFYTFHKQPLGTMYHTPKATITWVHNQILYNETLTVREFTYIGMGGKTTVFFPSADYTVVKNRIVIDWGTPIVHYHTPSTLGSFLPCD